MLLCVPMIYKWLVNDLNNEDELLNLNTPQGWALTAATCLVFGCKFICHLVIGKKYLYKNLHILTHQIYFMRTYFVEIRLDMR